MNYSLLIDQKETLVATYNKGIYTLIDAVLLVTDGKVPVITDDPLVDTVEDLQYFLSKQSFKQNHQCPDCVREDILTNEIE